MAEKKERWNSAELCTVVKEYVRLAFSQMLVPGLFFSAAFAALAYKEERGAAETACSYVPFLFIGALALVIFFGIFRNYVVKRKNKKLIRDCEYCILEAGTEALLSMIVMLFSLMPPFSFSDTITNFLFAFLVFLLLHTVPMMVVACLQKEA